MKDSDISDHNLYLLVDGQLDAISKKRLMKKIHASADLEERLAGISKVKELISLAYVQEIHRPAPVRAKTANFSSSLLVAMAASLIIGFGLTLGWITHQQHDFLNPVLVSTNNSEATPGAENYIPASTRDVRKFILHVSFLDEAQLENAITETSSILNSYASVGLPVKMELAFNLQAVRIFEPQHIDQAQKVKALISRHQNLQLYACSESLDRFLDDLEKPEEMSAFHTDRIVEEMITERIRQGWIYIKV